MHRSPPARRLGAACAVALAIALAAGPVAAQPYRGDGSDDPGMSSGSGMRGRGGGMPGRGQQGQQPRKAPLPEIKAAPEPWPRLDPGAVLCRTPDDLHQHLVAVAARLDGGNGGGEPAGCRVIRARIGVVVLAREAPGRTQVRTADAPVETGWTDAFLPTRAGP